MTRDPIRVPGFGPAAEANAPENVPTVASPARVSPRAGARQLNVRVLLPLHERYKRLLRELDDEGFDTSMSELVQALLHGGPVDSDDAKRILRAWRRALDPEL